MSRYRPVTARLAPQRKTSSQNFTPLPFVKKCFTAVLFGSNGNSYTVCTVTDMCVCTHVVHNMETLVWNSVECRV